MGSLWCSNVLCGGFHKVLIHSRHLNLSSTQQSVKNSLSKQGKIFNKFILGPSKKKRTFIFDDTRVPSSGGKLNLGHRIKTNKENSRRIAVLNSLFMKHISDLLVTGNIGVDLLGKGLEISRVSMNPNFNQLNVFWGSYSEENVVELEKILPDIGYTLRHELSQLRVIGIVPRILFVKDKNFSNGAKVDYLLRMADFGEDHESSELESDFKVSFTPYENKSRSDDQESNEITTLEDEEVMPVMRHDVFNLDHQLIMNKILKKMQKSRAFHRFEPNLAIKSDGNSITASTIPDEETMTREERKDALAKFILSRRILQEKKRQNKYKSDMERYTAQELRGEDDDGENDEEEDYIEEDFEKNK